MKTCFVSMPVGRKNSPASGASIDFDRVYDELVVPAVSQAGLALRSWRDVAAGASIQKQALGDIISCDVMLVDVTTSNPNVMYELGVRHAANRGPTVLLRGGRESVPFYAGYLQAVIYDPDIDLDQPQALRQRLAEALRSATRRNDGSPVYEFFPSMRVELPEELRPAAQATQDFLPSVQRALVESMFKSAPQVNLSAAEASLRGATDASPESYLAMLRAYRNVGDWDRLIDACETLPPAVAEDPQALQLLALALNRRSHSGDQDRAVAVMRKLIDETGGDAETFGILGRIHKERWKSDRLAADLDAAIDYYRRGFELQPSDLYAAFNVVSLRYLRGDPIEDPDTADLIRQLKDLLGNQLQDKRAEFWVLNTALELAVIERDWSTANSALSRALETGPSPVVRSLSVESLQRLGERLAGQDAAMLGALIDTLRSAQPGGEYA